MKTSAFISMRSRVVAWALTGAGCFGGNLAFATEAVSNLAEPEQDHWSVIYEAMPDPGNTPQWVAMSFLTGTAATALDSVDLRAFHITDATTGFTVSLASDPDAVFGGIPGTALSTLNGGNPGVLADYSYTDPANTLLLPNTPYWIIASLPFNPPDAEFGWRRTASTGEAGLPGWEILDGVALSADQGGSW